MQYRLWCDRASNSATAIHQNLDNCLRIRRENSRWRPRRNHVFLNWGSTSTPSQGLSPLGGILNSPQSVTLAANKIETFRHLTPTSVRHPEYSYRGALDEGVYERFIGICRQNGRSRVVCRDTVTGHSGQGVRVVPIVDRPMSSILRDIDNAPLVTAYIPRSREFRVHVFQGRAFFVQEKLLRRDEHRPETPDWQVRTHSNGFIFANQDIEVPEDVVSQGIKAVTHLNLDFGAVDIGYVKNEAKAYVFEVNTAPGLEEDGTTLQKYIEVFDSYLFDME